MSMAQIPMSRVALAEDFTIYSAAQNKENLLGQLDSSQGLELDLSGVEEMDSAGLQVLMLLKREADNRGKPLHLINHSQAVVEVFELLDLAGYFGDPLVIPAEWHKK